MAELGSMTKSAAKDWRDTLMTFRSNFNKKYGASLCPRGSGSWLKDASKKVQWLKERDDILDLRTKLHTASDMITLLVLAAIGYVPIFS